MRLRVPGFALLVIMLGSCGSPPLSTNSIPASSGTLVSTAIPTATVVPHTEVVLYVPTVLPTTQRSGSCWGPSIAVYRNGAYRCMADNEILDPCFAGNNLPDAVICEPDPTEEHAGIQLNLTAPLPTLTNVPEPGNGAWLVELPGGMTCSPFTGTLGKVNDQLITYHCAGRYDEEQTVLLGDVMMGDQWTATQAIILPGNSGPQLKSTEVVTLRRVWQ